VYAAANPLMTAGRQTVALLTVAIIGPLTVVRWPGFAYLTAAMPYPNFRTAAIKV
jgi:hypothetical protein